MRRRGLGEEHDSAGSDIVGAYEGKDTSVSGRVYLLLLLDGVFVAWLFREVLW